MSKKRYISPEEGQKIMKYMEYQKAAEATAHLIGNKIVNNITGVS